MEITMAESISIAAIGLAATTVAGLIWVVKYFANTLAHDLKEHTKAAIDQQFASQALEKTVRTVGKQAELSAQNSQEQLKFMKRLNGKLENAVVQKVVEQNVEHQHVAHKE
jgi:hypothetical protein